MMRNRLPLMLMSVLCLPFIMAAKPLPEVDVTVTERPWLAEAEFEADVSLYARHDQTVVLDLESAGKGKSAIRKNSVRFLVEKVQDFSFCIPDDEPYIRRIRLKRNGGPTVMNSRRGGACNPVELAPGSYLLDIFHDGRALPQEGKKAFLHRPERQRVRLSDSMGAPLQEQLIYPNFFVPTAGKSPLGLTFYLVSLQSQTTSMWISALSALDVPNVWSFPGPPDIRIHDDSRELAPWAPANEWDATIPASIPVFEDYNSVPYPKPIQFVQDNCNSGSKTWSCAIGFLINDQGGGRFTMSADVENPAPAVIRGTGPNPSQIPLEVASVTNPNPDFVEFNFLFKAFVDASTMPPLQKGEFAVYGQCDFEGTAFVFNSDVDFAVFSTLLNDEVSPPDDVKSLKLGPSTFLRMTRLQSEEVDIGADIKCGSLAPGKFTIFVDALAFIAATNSCINCNLTGIDFSGDDFSGVDFSGAIFADAILAGTNFSSADLTDADFSTPMSAGSGLVGTVFDGASLSCTSFRQADVTAASFNSVVLNTDQSCYLNLSGATLDFDSFATDDWRYLDLSSSTVKDVPQTLSTAATPLDMSGAILGNVTWLENRQLDNINLGCHVSDPAATTACPASNGTAVCATLHGLQLQNTSLKKACLQNASLEGASLISSNLDEADLRGALLIGATLDNAFMRNVRLSGADLSGASAANANFYTVSGGTAEATGITAPGADFTEAYLAGADFSGLTTNLQSTTWTGSLLINANFSQADLSINTSGGVNTGVKTTFKGAYLHGALFEQAILDDVIFLNTYWDLLGSRGEWNILIPANNLDFRGYWKDPRLPECPPTVEYESNPPPMDATDVHNVCPDSFSYTGGCDLVWGQPHEDKSLAFFKTAVPDDLPQIPGLMDEDQCGGANNPVDLCWTITNNPALCPEN